MNTLLVFTSKPQIILVGRFSPSGFVNYLENYLSNPGNTISGQNREDLNSILSLWEENQGVGGGVSSDSDSGLGGVRFHRLLTQESKPEFQQTQNLLNS